MLSVHSVIFQAVCIESANFKSTSLISSQVYSSSLKNHLCCYIQTLTNGGVCVRVQLSPFISILILFLFIRTIVYLWRAAGPCGSLLPTFYYYHSPF